MFFVSRTEYKHRKANQAWFKQTRLTQSKGTICQEMEYKKTRDLSFTTDMAKNVERRVPDRKKAKEERNKHSHKVQGEGTCTTYL